MGGSRPCGQAIKITAKPTSVCVLGWGGWNPGFSPLLLQDTLEPSFAGGVRETPT